MNNLNNEINLKSQFDGYKNDDEIIIIVKVE